MAGLLTPYAELVMPIWEAQRRHCPICGWPLELAQMREPLVGWSIDHVWPRRFRFRDHGNMLIAHLACNNGKAARLPTGCELLMLVAVNAQLGWKLTIKPPRRPDPASLIRWSDQISAPSALAIALSRARERRADP